MRDPKASAKSLTSLPLPEVAPTVVEQIAAKADNHVSQTSYKELNPEEARKFKSTTMPFNEYEHDLLTRAVEKRGGTVKQFMREAYIEKALRILEGKPIASD